MLHSLAVLRFAALCGLLCSPVLAMTMPEASSDTVVATTRSPTDDVSVSLATGLSLIPGAGQAYLGNIGPALLYAAPFAATVALGGSGAPAGAIAATAMLAQEAYFYSIFDSYRDARLRNDNRGYSYDIDKAELWDHLKAPYRAENHSLYNTALMAGSLVGIIGTTTAIWGWPLSRSELRQVRFNPGEHLTIAIALGVVGYVLFTPVGVAEDALFRGCIQGSMREYLPDPLALVGAAAIFGAVHLPNELPDATTSSPTPSDAPSLKERLLVRFFTAFSGGLVLGHIYQRSGGGLAQSMTAHTLFNTMLLMTAPFLSTKASQKVEISWTLPF